jgi:hypothetical protein
MKRSYVSDSTTMPMYKKSKKSQKYTGLSSEINKKISATVKRSLISVAERKLWLTYAANQPIPTGQGGFYCFNANIAPLIAQGTGDGQRIGNKVRVISSNIQGFVNLLPYSAPTSNIATPPLWLRIMLVAYRKQQTGTFTATDFTGAFLDVGTGVVPLQGNILDMTLPINKESWIVLNEDMCKLGVTGTSSTTPVNSGSYFDASTMSYHFNLDVKNTGVQMYNDATTQPTNKNAFLVIQAVTADGFSVSPQQTCEVHYVVKYNYIDM